MLVSFAFEGHRRQGLVVWEIYDRLAVKRGSISLTALVHNTRGQVLVLPITHTISIPRCNPRRMVVLFDQADRCAPLPVYSYFGVGFLRVGPVVALN